MATARVLVIDDSPTIRKLVDLTFRGTPWTVSFAASGREGIASALASPPGLVVLDYVLPDMRGIDVCTKLSSDAVTRDIPIVVITAKSEQVRAEFDQFASVIACLPKPFASEQLKRLVATAMARRDRSGSTPTLSREQKESAAQLLFARLRGALAHVPQWAAEMGSAAPAAYFARKLLTAERVEAIVDGLVPFYRELFASEERPSQPVDASAAISGDLRSWPVAELLNFFAASGRAGELTITHDDRKLVTYWRGGEILVVTTPDPDVYLRGAKIARVPADALARAKTEQRTSGKPVYVTLAEDGVALPEPLTELIHRTGRRLLLDALDCSKATFAWRDVAALPLYVDAHGRHVSTKRNTLVFGGAPPVGSAASTLDQLALERLRRDVSAASFDESAVIDRARGFSDKIRRFELDANERRVLAATDGILAVRDIASRASLPIETTRAVCARLAEVGLVVERANADPNARRPVLVLEPDVDGFQRPLEALLRDRALDAPVVTLADASEILDAIRRERPRLVILNASATGGELAGTARAVRSIGFEDLSLVAILESEAAREAEALRAAGFDAVFVKPVPYADLERLID
jgi:CheY-like chemotaxis protein